MAQSKEEIRLQVLDLVSKYYRAAHAPQKFVPKKSRVNYAGRVHNELEMVAAADAVLDFYLTLGKAGTDFEKNLSQIASLNYSVLVNSGSSANLLAISALRARMNATRLKEGDEVITAAAGFPTTVNPIIQNGLVPVFVDSQLGNYNLDVDMLEEAVSDKTRAIFFAHTLGNPANMDAIAEFVKKHDLILVEDCCDALGSLFDGKNVGTFGQMATFSFFPAHHITMGEGGAIATNSKLLEKILRSLRDWGRSCWCDPGKSNTCGVRFEYKISGIPYDHKYIYDNIGYNLKPLEMQAAIGNEQLKKLPSFIEKRKANFKWLFENFAHFEDYFILPNWHKKSDPSWFGFPLTVRKESGINLHDLQKFLDSNLIESRRLFSGNILRQPAYKDIRCRQIGSLKNADTIMESTFFLGVYPGIDKEMLEYVVTAMKEYLKK